MNEAKLFVDGGIRKGLMALGFVVYSMQDKELFGGKKTCGRRGTSNIAEYRALIAGIQSCLENKINIVHIYSDSLIMVKQITEAMKVVNPILIKHKDVVINLLEKFENYSIKWIPREENKEADKLVNEVFNAKNNKHNK